MFHQPSFSEMAPVSLSIAVYDQVSKYLTTEDDDHFVTRVAKITANFIAAPVFAVAMIVESIVRAILSIPVKLIHLFLPSSLSKGFYKKVVFSLAYGSQLSATTAAQVLSSLITNFFSSHVKYHSRMASYRMGDEVYNIFKPTLKFGFFN